MRMLSLPDEFMPACESTAVPEAPGWWFAFAGSTLLVHTATGGGTVELPHGAVWPFAGQPPLRYLFLGILNGQPCHAVELAEAPPPAGLSCIGLRELWGRLDEARLGIAGQALQLIEWDRSHGFCGRCGTPTQRRADERARHCATCGLTAYPRLSPVVMVRVLREDGRILLARAPRFAPGVYSVLAGFVEAGETLEQAIHREVAEEVGIQVRNLRYFASQSWPFPHSLMIAFSADYAGGELCVDGHEIVDAGWFSAADLPGLPSPMSMAWRLIQDFVTQEH